MNQLREATVSNPGLFRSLLTWHAEKKKVGVLTHPMFWTMIHMTCVPLIVSYFIAGNYEAALGFHMLGCLADYLDGYFARKRGLASRAGAILDPIADKAHMLSAYFLLSRFVPLSWFGLAFIVRATIEGGLVLVRFLGSNSPSANYWGKVKTWGDSFAVGFFLLGLCFRDPESFLGGLANPAGPRVAGYVIFAVAGILSLCSLMGRFLAHKPAAGR